MIDTQDTAFGARLERLAAGDDPRLTDLRRDALARFHELGWPTRRHEAWKYTSVAALARADFADPAPGAAPGAAPGTATLERLVSEHGLDPAVDRLVFVDGRFAADLSRLPGGFEARSLRESLAGGTLPAEALALASSEGHPFVALNLAQFEDGALLRVPAGVSVARPLELFFVQHARNAAAHPRVHVHLERQAGLTLIERHVDLGSGTSLCNAFHRLTLEAGASIDHYKLGDGAPESFHVGVTRASLERDARFRSHVFAFGGGLVRNETDVAFRAEGGEADLGGLYVVGGDEHVDCRTFVDHAVPHCSSRQVYHGAVGGHGHGVFSGEVLVRTDAQGTEAHQTNRNLLLSDTAKADTKPQLEISADDVKCSHGATIGQLDSDALFYLRSRALDETQARLLLTRAFAGELAGAVRPHSLQRTLEELLTTRLTRAAEGTA